MINEKSKLKYYLLLLLSLAVVSFDGVFFKMASGYPILSGPFIRYYSFSMIIYFIYALIWQIILKRIDLSIAYSFRSVVIVLGLVWSLIIFGQKITAYNFAGAVLIAAGIILVTRRTK